MDVTSTTVMSIVNAMSTDYCRVYVEQKSDMPILSQSRALLEITKYETATFLRLTENNTGRLWTAALFADNTLSANSWRGYITNSDLMNSNKLILRTYASGSNTEYTQLVFQNKWLNIEYFKDGKMIAEKNLFQSSDI